MHAFLNLLEKHNAQNYLKRGVLTTLQANMGNICNQNCAHCHINASPFGEEVMRKDVVKSILGFLARYKVKVLDITGGAPELNPNFQNFIVKARSLVEEIIVRSNLTVLLEPGNEYLPKFFKDYNVHLICSLPCYLQENVDTQRGDGVFQNSIKVLQLLNSLGFSKKKGLNLDLVYNPAGASLPPEQSQLEIQYKKNLRDNYNVEFDRLLTITNVPIKRFKDYLQQKGEYEKYFKLLKDNFNPLVLDSLMCRTFLSVGYDGKIYDCDFNQSLGLVLKSEEGDFLSIATLNPKEIEGKEISIGEHCLSCTAGNGSSCQGVLPKNKQKESNSIFALEEELNTKESVKDYYGKILKSTNDLKSSACCPTDTIEGQHKSILSKIEPEILSKFYGCGSPLPPALKGCTVLDLGCGSGRDAYLVSYLVGEEGFILGLDMTDEQLEVARKHKDTQMKKFGFKRCNVDFRKGYIEDLKAAGIADNSLDVVISNCVINLSPDKQSVFKEIFRVLKPGGELYFSDVFSGRRIPKHIKDDPILYGECLGGALYIEDFRRILRDLGCLDYRVISKRPIVLNNPELEAKVAAIDFYSITIRAFKLASLEDICEDYGQIATYLGTIAGCPQKFMLDDHHIFITDKPMLVCGNTAFMLSETRYSKYFEVKGDKKSHFGPFNCSLVSIKTENKESLGGGCC